jgi:hypothetical protein
MTISAQRFFYLSLLFAAASKSESQTKCSAPENSITEDVDADIDPVPLLSGIKVESVR